MKRYIVSIHSKTTGEKLHLVVTADSVDKATYSLCDSLIGPGCAYIWDGTGPYYD